VIGDRASRAGMPASVLLLLVLWVILMLIALVWGVGNAESKLSDSTEEVLSAEGYGFAVAFSGRDATLYGSVDSDAEIDEVIAVVDSVPGVRNVNSRINVVEPVEPESVAPTISMRLIGDAVSLRGVVPDTETRDDLIAAAEEQFGVDSVVDAVEVADNAVMLPWVGKVKDVLGHLGGLRSGGFSADESAFLLNGEVVSESIRSEMEQEIRLILDDSLSLVSNLEIAELPTPTFFASGDAGVVTLRGTFPDQETVDQIAEAARRLHPGATIINSMRIAEVAGPTWLDSIDGLLDVVTRLDPWTIDVSGNEAVISGLSLDPDLVGAIGVLTEEVVAGQLTVTTDVQVDPVGVATQLTDLLEGTATFETGSATLSEDGIELLNQAIEILQANPATHLIVEGHTDDDGDEASNLALSQERADAVVAFLSSGGIDPQRLTAIGYGETRPIADNVTEEGRAQNRRIEFVIQEGDE